MMNTLFKYIICIFFVAVSGEILAQKTFQPKATQIDWKGIIYRKEIAFEARIHTNGGLIGVNIGKIKTYYKTNYYHLSIGYMKDPREKRQNRNLSFMFPNRSRSFAFGKQNSVINIRGGVGAKRFISEKAKRKGIALGYDYCIGPSLALLKPYQLEIIYELDGGSSNDREIRTETYSDENAEKYLNYNDIFGGAGYWNNFGEISIVPGIHGKLGLFFSMGAFDEVVKSIEVGVMGDIYIKKLPIMVATETISNKPYFFNFYVNFLFGKRSN